jgi:hypothetical protein
MSRLTDFYQGTATDTQGRTLADIWAFSDSDLEMTHDFIQWLFPLRERSRFNPDAPVLTDEDIAAFRADPHLRANLLQSFDVFLAFLGLRYEEGRVVEAPDFELKKDVFAAPDHNWLRITRVLSSTRLLGLEGPSQALFRFLEEYRASGQSGITPDTFRYWEQAGGAHGGK